MTNTRVFLIAAGLVLGLLFAPAAGAGLVPVKPAGRRMGPMTRSGLTAEQDVIVYRLLADRIEAEQRLVVSAGDRPGAFWLGLPLPADKEAGPQDVAAATLVGGKRAKVELQRKPAVKGPDGVAAYQAFSIELGAGERAEIRLSWWQPHGEVDISGYWRFALVDPLWTAGAFQGPVAKLARRVVLTEGTRWMSSEPEAEAVGPDQVDYEARDRLLKLDGQSPAAGQVFLVKFKRGQGAVSPCGADAWAAVDGDPKTVWAAHGCPADKAWLDLMADCTGFGSDSPGCERLLKPAWVHGLSVRTPGGKARSKVIVEGYFGRRRVWTKTGRLNEPVAVRNAKAVTRFRVSLPGGLPAGGAEVGLMRVDAAEAHKAYAQVLGGRGFAKMGKRCVVELSLINPVPLHHATFVLKPGSKVDAYLLNMDCTDGRKREPFHEPVQCHHTAAEHLKMGVTPEMLASGHAESHYKRARKDRIELPLDPTCSAKILRIIAPPTLCTRRFKAPVPRLELTY